MFGSGSASAREYAPVSPVDYWLVDGNQPDGPDSFFEEAAEEFESCFQRWRDGSFTIVPEETPFLDVWDIIVILALGVTAVVLPFEVALLTQTTMALRWFNIIVDTIFAVDIVVTFNVAYSVVHSMSKDSYERAPLKIAKQYMAFPFSQNFTAGWFWPDVLTVIPWEMFYAEGEPLHLIRILRLIRMFRLIRVVKLFNRWHTHFGFSFALVNVTRCITITLITVHWLACCWACLGISQYSNGTPTSSWLNHWLQIRNDPRDVESLTPFEVYNLALYFAVMTLTTVGLGDILPQTQLEVSVASAIMLLTGFEWAWIVGCVVHIIMSMDAFGGLFNQLMDDMNLLMQARGVSLDLRHRLRKYLHEAFNVHRQRHQQSTIKWLSHGLQGELALASGVHDVCDCVFYLRNLTTEVLVDIALHWLANMFSPDELITEKSSVSVIRKGFCLKMFKLLGRDAVIGHDMILATERLRDSACARTITFVEVQTLNREDLFSVCERHADFNRRIRKYQIKLALWRGFIHKAQQIETERFQQAEGGEDGTWSSLARQLTPSQTVGAVRGGMQSALVGFSVQESLNQVLLELQALRSKTEDGQAELERRLTLLDQRVAGLGAAGGAARSGARNAVNKVSAAICGTLAANSGGIGGSSSAAGSGGLSSGACA